MQVTLMIGRVAERLEPAHERVRLAPSKGGVPHPLLRFSALGSWLPRRRVNWDVTFKRHGHRRQDYPIQTVTPNGWVFSSTGESPRSVSFKRLASPSKEVLQGDVVTYFESERVLAVEGIGAIHDCMALGFCDAFPEPGWVTDLEQVKRMAEYCRPLHASSFHRNFIEAWSDRTVVNVKHVA